LRAGSVILKPQGVMEWHSTRHREELLIVLRGQIQLEWQQASGRSRSLALPAGRCASLPPKVWHRVVNAARQDAHYLYVTGGAA